MAENTKIQWCDFTFNPWSGCTKVSEGCRNCYAAVNYSVKMRGVKWGPQGNRVVASESMWKNPLNWNKAAQQAFINAKMAGDPIPERPRVFCASLADVFEDWTGPIADSRGLLGHVFLAGGEWGFGPDTVSSGFSGKSTNVRMLTMQDVRHRLFDLIDATPNLNWLLLTKRPENVGPMLWDTKNPQVISASKLPPNVWLGVSCENQAAADERIPLLLKTPAAVRFLSCEPLLDEVNLHFGKSGESPVTDAEPFNERADKIDWCIIGGESGPGARSCNVEWIRSLVEQCKAAGVPAFVKQLGAVPQEEMVRPGCSVRVAVETLHLHDKKGGDIAEWPESLRIREFPKVSQT